MTGHCNHCGEQVCTETAPSLSEVAQMMERIADYLVGDRVALIQENKRLDALNKELVEALRKIDSACAEIPEELEGYIESLSDALAEARAAIAKAQEKVK